jgi:hypothetical protein
MRLRIARRLIAAIGITAITLGGNTAIAGANPPPDKKQHQRHDQPKAKPEQQPAPRDALNNGYREGWLAGTADREDGWRPSYDSCYAYRDANYGYNGYYLDRATYNYYFREGFRRGYADGYDRSYRYGRYSNGTRSLLGSVLNVVLRIERLG